MSALAASIRAVLRQDPGGRAVQWHGAWIGWGALAATADALDAQLTASGAGQGTPIGLVVRNRPEPLAALFGLLGSGRAVAILSGMQPPDKLGRDIAEARLACVVAESADWELPGLRAAARQAGGQVLALEGPGKVSLLERAGPGPHRAPDPALGLEMLTSGTTGVPKRIPLPAEAVRQAALDMLDIRMEAEDPRLPMGDRPPFVMFYPLTNISGLYFACHTAVLGWPMVLQEKFTVADWRDSVVEHRPRLLWLPPTAIRMALDADVPPADLSSALAMRSGAAPLDETARRRFEARYAMPVLPHYGATEFCGVVAGWTRADHVIFGESRRASLGRARPGITLRCVAPDGTPVPAGESGLLEVQVPRVGPGWVRTNDLAVVDAEGFLFLEGRADDAINRGGFKIVPEQVADVLRRHPAVRDAIVLGVEDPRLGQVPVAAVEPRAGMAPTAEDLLAWLRQELPAWQVPARLLVAAALPRTTTLKVDRRAASALFG